MVVAVFYHPHKGNSRIYGHSLHGSVARGSTVEWASPGESERRRARWIRNVLALLALEGALAPIPCSARPEECGDSNNRQRLATALPEPGTPRRIR